jgi:hypothetical protein
MHSKTLSFTAALGFAGISLVLAWVGLQSARRAEAAAAAMAESQSALDARVKAAQGQIAASRQREAALRADFKSAQMRQATAPAAQKTPARPNRAALIATNPKVRAAYVRSFRANLTMNFLPLYHMLALSPAQIEKFEDLMTESEQEKLDLQAAALSQGLAVSDPAIATLQQQQNEQLRDGEVGLLGNAGYQQLQQFDRIQPLEDPITRMAYPIAETAPITEPQMDQLLNVLANASGKFQAGGPADPMTIDWPTALPQVGQILNGTQYANFKAAAQIAQVMALVNQYYQMQSPAK